MSVYGLLLLGVFLRNGVDFLPKDQELEIIHYVQLTSETLDGIDTLRRLNLEVDLLSYPVENHFD